MDRAYDFVSRMKTAVFISLTLIVIAIFSLFYHGGLNWGVEFSGGTEIHLKFEKTVEPDKVRSAMHRGGLPAQSVQQVGLSQDNEYLIRFPLDAENFDKTTVQTELEKLFKSNNDFKNASILRIDFIGPKIGKELIRKAVISIVLGWLVIMFYLMVRFEFGFSLGAVIAIMHDIIITIGAITLLDKEFTLTIVAGLLTVIGYSVNDTIVIFDRIRENLKKTKRMDFKDLVNESVNQTLSRTIWTVFTVLLVLVPLFFLGGSVIHDFAFTLIVGVIVGTYSSIFVASSFIIYWRARKSTVT